MATNGDVAGERNGGWWRIVLWGGVAFLLLLPALAMQFTSEVDWDETDFIVMGVMLSIAAGTFHMAARSRTDLAYRTGVGVAVLAGFLLVWVNLAVGFLGDEDNPANLIFLSVIAVAIIGSAVARFDARGMARAFLAAAGAQFLAGVVGFAAGLGSRGWMGLYEVVLGTSLFVGLWLLSAWILSKAGR